VLDIVDARCNHDIHENPSSGSPDDPCRRTDAQTNRQEANNPFLVILRTLLKVSIYIHEGGKKNKKMWYISLCLQRSRISKYIETLKILLTGSWR